MKVTMVYGAKGGVGTTVVACGMALGLAEKGHRVLLMDTRGDCPAVFGLSEPIEGEGVLVNDRLVLVVKPSDYNVDGFDHIIIDGDTAPCSVDERVLVTRACYLALRRGLAVANKHKPDRVVCVMEPGRALSARDVERTFGAPVTEIPYDPMIARAVDAGLLASRMPANLRQLTKEAVG